MALLQRVRAQIWERGGKDLKGQARTFKIFDKNGDHKIDAEEFYLGLCKIQITVSFQEAIALMFLFDTNRDGFLDYEEFLAGISVSVFHLTNYYFLGNKTSTIHSGDVQPWTYSDDEPTTHDANDE